MSTLEAIQQVLNAEAKAEAILEQARAWAREELVKVRHRKEGVLREAVQEAQNELARLQAEVRLEGRQRMEEILAMADEEKKEIRNLTSRNAAAASGLAMARFLQFCGVGEE